MSYNIKEMLYDKIHKVNILTLIKSYNIVTMILVVFKFY